MLRHLSHHFKVQLFKKKKYLTKNLISGTKYHSRRLATFDCLTCSWKYVVDKIIKKPSHVTCYFNLVCILKLKKIHLSDQCEYK